MNIIGRLNETLKDIAKEFTVESLARDLQPAVNEIGPSMGPPAMTAAPGRKARPGSRQAR